MAPLLREPPGPPDPICRRCSKPITPGTAAQYTGRPVHMRCLAGETRLESIEPQDRASLERAHTAAARELLVNTVRRSQTHCPACGQPFAMSRSLLFQGDHLVHAACWRDDPKPFDDPPPAG